MFLRISCVLTLTAVVAAGGELRAPIPIGAGVHSPANVRLWVDAASNAFVAFDGYADATPRRTVYYGFSLGGFASLQSIAVDGSECENAAFALGQLGVVHMVFEARSAEGVLLYYVTNRGGPFQVPERLTSNIGVRESSPSVWADSVNGFRTVWEENDGTASRVVYRAGFGQTLILVENGSRPVAYLSPASERLHVLFLRNGDLYYVREGSGPVRLAQAVRADARYGLVTTGNTDIPHVVFSTDLGVWYTCLSGSSFTAPTLVAAGASAPCVSALPDATPDDPLDDAVACTYVAWDDAWRRINRGGAGFGAEERLGGTAEAETEAACAYDRSGFFHMVAIASEQVSYRNDIPVPQAAFSVDKTFGEVPLDVRFTDESVGAIRSRFWEFGDGGTSNERDPVHCYEQPGKYAVTLTVTGPGGRSQAVRQALVEAIAPRNHLAIPEIMVWVGQGAVRHPLLAQHPEPLQGGQVAITFRDEYLTRFDISIKGTRLETIKPEFMAPSITDGENGEKHLVVGIIIDVDPPYDGRMLPAAAYPRVLFYLEYGVSYAAPVNVRIPFELRNGIGDPPIANVFTVAGAQSAWPTLKGGGATTAPRPACLFLRGDGNFDRAIDVADAIFVLAYLFAHASTPACLDACDANDSGNVDIGDAIYVLSYLFAGGSMPAYPFPDFGMDPSADGLGTCTCPK